MLESLLGVRLTLWIGQAVPRPAPAAVMTALESVEVAASDSERCGFELSFQVGRSNALVGSYPLVANPDLNAGSRVALMATIGALPVMLMDGVIEATEFKAAEGETPAKHTARGKDLTFVMDREERETAHPAQGPGDIARLVLARYIRYGIVPLVVDPPAAERPNPVERTPMQRATDYAYLKSLAEQFDHIFTLTPGPVPLTSRAYWGPLPRIGAPQRALTVDMGPETNVTNLAFENVEAEAANVQGTVQDRSTNQALPVRSTVPLRPPLAARPSLANPATARTELLGASGAPTAAQALAEAQAQSDASSDTVKVTGDLDTGRYGAVLEPRRLVGLRGAGHDHDGLYYVKDVVHKIAPGSWTQSFTLTREGTGTTTPVVLP